jgi:isoprenylcysteine carboxyl methyltransferase (ICMT) family protein YpbQ
MKEPEDGYFHAGLLILGRWNDIDGKELHLYGLSWLVKGFFLPFMLAGSADRLEVLNHDGINFSSFAYLYTSGVNLTYTIDVVFGAIGYLMTLRILDAQIQSVESTILGWLCTISCYVPFSTLIWAYVLNYKGKTNWYDWLAHYPIVCITWGFAIMILHVVYVWSTCSFGCRFSNLTNRGIITRGPYRYLKHPAYLSKNIAWWLMSVPFVAHHTFWDATRACICLLITNFIYGLRAWTEERHLLNDPAYQVYYRWIEEHGLGSQFRSLWKK